MSIEQNNKPNNHEIVKDDATDKEIADYFTYHIDNPCKTPDGKGNVRAEWIQLVKNILKNREFKEPLEKKRLKDCIDKYENE